MIDLKDIEKRLEAARKETEDRTRELRKMVDAIEKEIAGNIAVDDAFYDCIQSLRVVLDKRA